MDNEIIDDTIFNEKPVNFHIIHYTCFYQKEYYFSIQNHCFLSEMVARIWTTQKENCYEKNDHQISSNYAQLLAKNDEINAHTYANRGTIH